MRKSRLRSRSKPKRKPPKSFKKEKIQKARRRFKKRSLNQSPQRRKRKKRVLKRKNLSLLQRKKSSKFQKRFGKDISFCHIQSLITRSEAQLPNTKSSKRLKMKSSTSRVRLETSRPTSSRRVYSTEKEKPSSISTSRRPGCKTL